jgi:hypothetical protein
MFVDRLQTWKETAPPVPIPAAPSDEPWTAKEAATEFAGWLRAASDTRTKHSDTQLASLYMVWCELHESRYPASENMVRNALRRLPGIKRETVNTKSKTGKRRRCVCWIIGPVPAARKRRAA